MKRLQALLCLLAIVLTLPLFGARASRKLTITAGTPIRLSTVNNTMVDRILIQMLSAASGDLGYVMLGVDPGTTPVAGTWPTLQLCAATSTAPGCTYSDQGQNIDISRIWIDGAHTGDTILVTYEVK